jgi:hypothetical protein
MQGYFQALLHYRYTVVNTQSSIEFWNSIFLHNDFFHNLTFFYVNVRLKTCFSMKFCSKSCRKLFHFWDTKSRRGKLIPMHTRNVYHKRGRTLRVVWRGVKSP